VTAGKKLRWTDGLSALLTLVRYRIQPRRRFDREYEVETAGSARRLIAW
jgi:hypothetical protein